MTSTRRAHYQRAGLVEAAPDDAVLGYWHGNVGMIALRSGDLVTARQELEQARDHLGREPAWYLGRVLDKLGTLARLEGRADERRRSWLRLSRSCAATAR